MKKRFNLPENNDGNNATEVSVFFQKPRVNMHNGQSESGGFYVSFNTGAVEHGDGYSSFRFEMFAGFKVKVAEGSRDSKKKCQQILDSIPESVAIAAHEGDRATAYQLLKQVFA